MKTILSFLLLFSLVSLSAYAQDIKDNDSAKAAKSVFLEIGANGVTFSANFDTRFSKKQGGLGMRLGLGFFGGSGAGVLTVPVGLNYLAGKAPNFFEAGMGYTYAKLTSSDEFFSGDGGLLFPSVGYRYQAIGKGIVARIVISPAINLGVDGGWLFFGGVSIGYKF
ncbi:hypothetical protein BH10BAC2_BH10BAC2_41330 [soil metagenome]